MSWLNHREQATAVWLAAGTVWALTRQDVRASVGQIVRTFANPKVWGVFLAAAVYTSGVVCFLAWVGLWDASLIKETIYWFLGTAFVILMNLPNKDGRFLAKHVRGGVNVAAFVAFIANVANFPLYVELLFVPMMFFAYATLAVAQSKPEFAGARKALNGFVGVVGLVVIAFALVQIVGDVQGFVAWQTVQQFLIAPVMTAAFVPFAYAFALIMAYEMIFTRLGFALKDEGGPVKVPWRMRLATVCACGFRLRDANRFSPSVMPQAFTADSEEDVLRAIKAFDRRAA